MKRIFVDLHVIQTVPPSCVNRDDTGSPKTAVYGGATRARVSSQCWKRAMRKIFEFNIGVRTKKIAGLLEEQIKKLIKDECNASEIDKQAQEIANRALWALKLDIDKESVTEALVFSSPAQIAAIAKLAVTKPDLLPKKPLEKKAKPVEEFVSAFRNELTADIALFGRMVASNPLLNCDACAQVAHSISTHTVQNEYDYFTAVDDRAPEDNVGAGHLGTVEYNSSTLYRYATVCVHDLYKYMADETPAVVRGFADAFIRSMPTGKQNTFANRTIPDMVYVTVRGDQPLNLCGAFEKPVFSKEGYSLKSQQQLVKHAQSVYESFVGKPREAWAVGGDIGGIAEVMTLPGLLDRLEGWIRENPPEGR